MTTPSREGILTNLTSALQAIATAGGYKTTVKTVTREARPISQVPAEERPFIGIQTGIERKQTYAFGYMRCTVPVTLHCLIEANDGGAKDALMNDFEDDIIAAVSADPKRSNNAMTTAVVDVDDEAIPEAAQGYFPVGLEIIYWRRNRST